jgi:hypothetical protein
MRIAVETAKDLAAALMAAANAAETAGLPDFDLVEALQGEDDQARDALAAAIASAEAEPPVSGHVP